MTRTRASAFTLEVARASDFEALLALRLRAMRESLERLGRYDEARARERLAAGFEPEATQHIVVDGQRVGFVALKRAPGEWRLDHLYVEPSSQGRGIGAAVTRWACEQADAQQEPMVLCALKGSDANRFYRRHGFVEVGQGEWDIDYRRAPAGPGVRVVRAMWAAFQARDWARARTLMQADLQATWWTSGERFEGADHFVQVQARYPEGWTIHLLDVAALQDGRVLSLARVDQAPHRFFATSVYWVHDGLIASVDEYWATFEPPPAWREALAGRSTFDPQHDARAYVP